MKLAKPRSKGKKSLFGRKQTEGTEEALFSLDTLNVTSRWELTNDSGSLFWDLFISMYTNEHSKVIEFSFNPSKHIFETKRERDAKKKHEISEESKDGLAIIEEAKEDETAPQDPFKDPKSFSNSLELKMKSVNLSFI